jgi:hypothetical protein
MHIKIASFLELGTVLYMYAFVDFCKELGFVFGCFIGLPVSITYTQIGLLFPYVVLEFFICSLRDKAQVEQLLRYVVEEVPEDNEKKRYFKYDINL